MKVWVHGQGAEWTDTKAQARVRQCLAGEARQAWLHWSERVRSEAGVVGEGNSDLGMVGCVGSEHLGRYKLAATRLGGNTGPYEGPNKYTHYCSEGWGISMFSW